MNPTLSPPSSSLAKGSEEDTKNPYKDKGSALYNREGLVRYILCACQNMSKRGGLRDKPSKYVSHSPPIKSTHGTNESY
jgi:protein farnesyltransferase subunit beta